MKTNPLRVLAVEDNPADLRLLKEELGENASMNFEVVGAGTLREALQIFQTNAFAVSLLDLNLPDSFGLDGIDKILATPFAPPVIVLTELDSPETGFEALSHNAQDYLVKGKINSDVLIRCIRYAIQRDQSEKALRQMNLELEQRVAEQTAEIRAANEMLEQRVIARTAELQAANTELHAARLATLNLMEDTLEAKKQTEQVNVRLRESEQRLDLAQSIAHLGSWDLDLEKNYLVWSDEVYRIFGFKPQEFGATFEAFMEAVHPDDRAAVAATYSDALREDKTSFETEYRLIKKSNNDVRIVRAICENFRDENGKINRTVGIVHDITERKRAEAALQDSEQHFRLLFETMFQGAVYQDASGKIISMNPAAEQILGKTHEEFVGSSSVEEEHDTICEDGSPFPGMEHPAMVALSSGHTVLDTVMGVYNPRKQTYRWITIGAVPLFQPGENKPYQVYTLFDDITDRKQMEDALRLSEERFRLALKNAPVAVATQDRDLRFTWAYNQRTVRLADVIGKTDNDLFPAEAAARLMALKRQVLESGDEVKEQMWVTSGGQPVYLDIYLEPIRDKAGQITGVGIATVDLTRPKMAEDALSKARDELELRVQQRTEELAVKNEALSNEISERKEVERQLRIQTTAMEAAANGILITDPQGNIQWTNPALTQISGYDAGELVGQNTHIFNSGTHPADFYFQLWSTILSGQVWMGETVNRRKDGSLYVEEQTITPVRDENGQIPHFIAIKQDITQRKKAEEELAWRNQELREISKAEHFQRQFSDALVEAALVLNKSMKLDDVLPRILEQIKEVIPYQFADIALLDGENFYDAGHHGVLESQTSPLETNNLFALNDFILLKKMRQSGEPLLIPDTRQNADWTIVEGLEWSQSFLSAPLLVEEQVIGFVNLFAGQPDFFTPQMCDRLVAFAVHAAVAIQNAWLFEQVRASSERLQSLSRRLVEIQENERLYIARELHDEAGQALTSLMLDLRLLEKNASNPEIVLMRLAEMEDTLGSISKNLHNIAMALRPASLDHLGLVAALRNLVESVGERQGLRFSFKSVELPMRLPSMVETVIYRIVQEALTNVVRHACATQVDLVLTLRDDKLIVIVEDDGIGFDTELQPTPEHMGLFGMQERAQMIGSTLMIESAPGKGTTILVEVDYADPISDR